jgi:hypothetical protein
MEKEIYLSLLQRLTKITVKTVAVAIEIARANLDMGAQ